MVSSSAQHPEVQDRAWRALESVHDPEIPAISVVDLGVIREVLVIDDTLIAHVTPTYSGCPAVEVIEQDVLSALQRVSNAYGMSARVDRVLEPAWTTDWITARGRERLRSAGIAPPSGVGSVSPHDIAGSRSPKRTIAVMMEAGGAAARGAVPCPRCGSSNTSLVSEFGSTACKAIRRCNECSEPFDQFKNI
jgi:ring-1,2-phenylacetyl-CoA epoxidase subunit PaaD